MTGATIYSSPFDRNEFKKMKANFLRVNWKKGSLAVQ